MLSQVIEFNGAWSERADKFRTSLREFIKANQLDNQVKVTFYFEDEMRINFTKTHTWAKKITLNLFAQDRFLEHFYYSKPFTKSGLSAYDLPLGHLRKMVIKYDEPKSKALIEKNKLSRALNERYANTWTDLTTSGNFIKLDEVQTKKLNGIFSEENEDELWTAFEFGHTYTKTISTDYVNYYIEAEVGEDGIYRAYYSEESEFFDFRNYYYLLSPTLALLVEKEV